MNASGVRLLAALVAPAARSTPPLPPTMLVAAHPDDETVGAGSRLPRLARARFVCVTDGAPGDGRDAARNGLTTAQYAQARRGELQAVLARCGIPADRLLWLDCPDQQASLQLAALARRLAELLLSDETEAVLTQPFEGGHPDHDATAFIVHAAAGLLRARGGRPPEIVEMASYHRGPDGVRACSFLPPPQPGGSRGVMVSLTSQEQQRKSALMACFSTQSETLRDFPVAREGFRIAPAYDFRQPPHAGELHYEQYPWGMSGKRFRQLASEALVQLRLEGPL